MTRKTTIAEYIAGKLQAVRNCQASDTFSEWEDRHMEDIEAAVRQGPSGSGWDCGTSFDADKSGPNKLVFFGSFHHMDDVGSYDGWTEHVITVRPDFIHRLDIKISGQDRNGIKDHIYDIFHNWLTGVVENNT